MEPVSDSTGRAVRQLTTAIWAATIALVAVLIFWIVSWVFPPPYVSQFTERTLTFEGEPSESYLPTLAEFEKDRSAMPSHETPFHEMPIEQKIEHASLIAVAEFEEAEDGRMRAIIKEILKKAPGTVSYYDVGDEHPMSSFYPSSGRSRGDGLVLFFAGSPATMRLSMTYTGDRISSLGDMPLALLREKCQE